MIYPHTLTANGIEGELKVIQKKQSGTGSVSNIQEKTCTDLKVVFLDVYMDKSYVLGS